MAEKDQRRATFLPVLRHDARLALSLDRHTLQLALPLGDTLDDFPAVPMLRMDWYGGATLKRWRATTAPVATTLNDDWDTSLL